MARSTLHGVAFPLRKPDLQSGFGSTMKAILTRQENVRKWFQRAEEGFPGFVPMEAQVPPLSTMHSLLMHQRMNSTAGTVMAQSECRSN